MLFQRAGQCFNRIKKKIKKMKFYSYKTILQKSKLVFMTFQKNFYNQGIFTHFQDKTFAQKIIFKVGKLKRKCRKMFFVYAPI